MEGLFNPHSIVLHIINAAILLVALYFLLLKPLASLLHHWKVACRTHDNTD